ncbi:MAG: pyrroloquinoline quinone biosynthesis protein PqqC, partial [Verrucomicrobiota bacterium]|nr:pyrroloquinoline quinone biosynthesis protein PqqC [Verrucomicrobiota bacterium]
DPKSYEYFSVHVEADREHAAAEREMLQEHVNDSNAVAVKASVERVLNALWDLLSGVCHRHAIAC